MDSEFCSNDSLLSPDLVVWPTTQESYELGAVIGIGGTCIVHCAHCLPLNRECAIKIQTLRKGVPCSEEILESMLKCKHENIVTYYTGFVVSEELWLVVELMECGSILDIIKNKMQLTNCKYGVFDEVTIATVLKYILKALEYLHSRGETHRFVCAGNILLGKDCSVKLADFGIPALLAYNPENVPGKVRRVYAGTPLWLAPEVLERRNYSEFEADIWSFGITAIELATGHPPYYNSTSLKALILTITRDPPTIDTASEENNQYREYGKQFREMIASCLQKVPSGRPNATELLQHPFFEIAEDKEFLKRTLIPFANSLETRIQNLTRRKLVVSSRPHRRDNDDDVWSDDEQIEVTSSKLDNEKLRFQVDDDSSFLEILSESQLVEIITLVLRIREPHKQFPSSYSKVKELYDIKFQFEIGKDSAEAVVNEMVSAGLVDSRDVMCVSDSIQELLDARQEKNHIVFKLETSTAGEGFVDEKLLIGYAQISIIE